MPVGCGVEVVYARAVCAHAQADVPEPLVALLAKALDPVPANRFPSAASMLEALAATGV